MNLHIITGRLTRDPEIATTQKGTLRARFTLAVNRPKRAGSEEDAADRQGHEDHGKWFYAR